MSKTNTGLSDRLALGLKDFLGSRETLVADPPLLNENFRVSLQPLLPEKFDFQVLIKKLSQKVENVSATLKEVNKRMKKATQANQGENVTSIY